MNLSPLLSGAGALGLCFSATGASAQVTRQAPAPIGVYRVMAAASSTADRKLSARMP